MTRPFPKAWLIMPAFVLSASSLQAQNTPEPAPKTVAPTLPAEPVITAPPVQVAPPQTMPAPIPAPVPTPPPVKKPPLPPKQTYKKTDAGDKLRPGQFIWENRTAYKNPLKIIVILDFQRLYVFDGDELVAFTTISSGKKGFETPTGIFPILQKNIKHFSNIYDNAPMPYMQRLTWDGIALHAGAIPAYPASHGCIRMPLGFAKSLFGVTNMAQEVIVLQNTSKAAAPKEEPKPAPAPQPVPTPQPEAQKPKVEPKLTPEQS